MSEKWRSLSSMTCNMAHYYNLQSLLLSLAFYPSSTWKLSRLEKSRKKTPEMDENFSAPSFIVRKIKLFITSNENLIFNHFYCDLWRWWNDSKCILVGGRSLITSIINWITKLFITFNQLLNFFIHPSFDFDTQHFFHSISFIKTCICSRGNTTSFM